MTLKINQNFTKNSRIKIRNKKKRIEVRIPLYQKTTPRFFKPNVKIKGRRKRTGGNKMSLATNRVITKHMHNCPKRKRML
jgi:hypothetical protein